MRKLQKPISILTSVTTVLWLSGIAMLAPISTMAATVVDGDTIRNPNAAGDAKFDIYIAKLVGTKKFKRLVLNPQVFESYGHLDKNKDGDKGWNDVITVDQATMDSYTSSDLTREINDTKVYKLVADGDTGTKQWLNMTAADFVAQGYDWDSIYIINSTDRDNYTTGSDITVGGGTGTSTGTLSVALASDTPAAGIAVKNAARVPFTKINVTATNGDVIIDSLVVQRTSLGQDGGISSLDLIDVASNMPINVTSKTLNSEHKASFIDDITVTKGTTKSLIVAANMPSSLTSYAGETPSISVVEIALKGTATLNASLPITGNTMTLNSTITIGTATVQRGAYGNASSTSIQVGKQDYTFFSFQVQAGSAEKVSFSQIKVYQQGSASLGTDLKNLELLADTTKIADGTIQSSKYAVFNFTEIVLDKGALKQFQVRADVEDGSARTIDLGIYKATDLLVKGQTYGYNITPTYSSTGASSGNPVLSDNEFTISNGTLQVERSNDVAAGNISVANNQLLGSFKFSCKGEPINISALTLTVVSTTASSAASYGFLTGVELVDPSGVVVAGPTDPAHISLQVAWTDTFTVPVGDTIYKVRGDLATNGNWTANDTIYVYFTPSAMTATGNTTGNTIAPTPSSAVQGNTQTVKAAALKISRKTIPSDQTVIVGQTKLKLGSWSFDATSSGEDVRITQVAIAGHGQAATNTSALTVYADNVSKAPVNDALSASTNASIMGSSTFAFDEPIVIKAGKEAIIDLYGDKSTVASNSTEKWGLTDSGGDSVVAYGVSTGNTISETITVDDGAQLTSTSRGTLTIETDGNPASAIVLAGSTGNVFTKVKLLAQYEDLNVDFVRVHVGDGSYSFSGLTGEYRDVTNVALYDGTTKLGEHSIPSDGYYKFEFSKGVITIAKGGSKTITAKADMATIDPNTDNAPGTNSADIIVGLGGENSVKTTGNFSNLEITGSSYETYRSSSSSAMVLRTSKPIVVKSTTSDRLGAASFLTNGTVCSFAYKITADASGGDVLIFRTTFVFATSGTGMTLSSAYIKDENGNTIKSAANPTAYANVDGTGEYYYTATFNNPDFNNGNDQESIKITSGQNATFTICSSIAGANSGESFSTFLVGDTVSTSNVVNTENIAVGAGLGGGAYAGWAAPVGNLSDENYGNFIWSDNYKGTSYTGSGINNATNTPQWYNGHLVPGLENAISTTPYVIGWSG